MKMEYSLCLQTAHVLFMDEVWSVHVSYYDQAAHWK